VLVELLNSTTNNNTSNIQKHCPKEKPEISQNMPEKCIFIRFPLHCLGDLVTHSGDGKYSNYDVP